MKAHNQNRGHYEKIACGTFWSWKQKETLICPVCGYTSRVRLDNIPSSHNNTDNASFHCPKHSNVEMQTLGTKTRIPKKGSKKFRKFMK